MTKLAFVTGATGFLGAHLSKMLHDSGWKVTAIYRSQHNHPLLADLPIKWVKASLEDAESLHQALPTEPFVAFHIAASTAQWKPQFADQERTNIQGTANLLTALQQSSVKRLIHTSSITTYGYHTSVITESTPQLGIDSGINYAITKHKAELLVKEAVEKGEIDAVILNPCHIVGPWDTHNWIQLFQHVKAGTIPGVPPAMGNFTWVEHIAQAHINAVEKGRTGENYILGGPHKAMLEVVNEMERYLGRPVTKKAMKPALLLMIEPFYRMAGYISRKEPTLTPDKVKLLIKSFNADDRKARLELGYEHKPISEIVADTYRWLDKYEQQK